jgi:hypothetical protein
MGVTDPMPPFMMNAAAPEGALPRRFSDQTKMRVVTTLPRRLARGPEAGSLK